MSYQLYSCQLLILHIYHKTKWAKWILHNVLFTNDSCFGKAKMIVSIIFSHCFTKEKKQLSKPCFNINITWNYHNSIAFASLLCEFSITTTNSPRLFHLRNVITSMLILLAFRRAPVEAADFPATTCCLFFSLLLTIQLSLS